MSMTGLDLRAPGAEISLIDGTSPSLRYPFRALALLEARFGSIGAVQAAIDSTGDGAAFGPLVQIIGAGLVGPGGFEPHVREYQDTKGVRRIQDIVYRRRTDGVDLADLLHPGLLGDYTRAFIAALNQALRTPGAPEGNGQGATVETVTADALTSPGTTSTTSPAVPSTFRPTPSGS
jgi:hypothetical protein